MEKALADRQTRSWLRSNEALRLSLDLGLRQFTRLKLLASLGSRYGAELVRDGMRRDIYPKIVDSKAGEWMEDYERMLTRWICPLSGVVVGGRPGEEPPRRELCAAASRREDMKSSRVFTRGDYLGSVVRAHLEREFGGWSRFTARPDWKPAAYDRDGVADCIEDQLYGRLQASLVALASSPAPKKDRLPERPGLSPRSAASTYRLTPMK